MTALLNLRRATILVVGLVACSRFSAEPASAREGHQEEQAPATAAEAPVLPTTTTPAAELEPTGYRHTQVFTLDRDFGRDEMEIVLDAWSPAGQPSEIADVRLWWLKTHKDGERGPFSAKTKRHFDIDYERVDASTWKVYLVSDGKRFTFAVTARDGHVVARSNVMADGDAIANCVVRRGHIEARRFLGAPVGIDRVDVECEDPQGNLRKGKLVSR